MATSCELDTPVQPLQVTPSQVGPSHLPQHRKEKLKPESFRAVLVVPEREAPRLLWCWALATLALCPQCGCGVVESSHSRWVMQGSPRTTIKTPEKQKKTQNPGVFQAPTPASWTLAQAAGTH